MRAQLSGSRKRARHVLLLIGVVTLFIPRFAQAEEKKVAVVFSGGSDLDPRDGGRPVVLIAAGLGVSPEIFREAFRGVTPARNGAPTGPQVHANKASLLKVLQPYGVTNARLDEVSDYYRYRPQNGEHWKSVPARAHAIVDGGRIVKVVVTEPGSGYSSPPQIKVAGVDTSDFAVKLRFDKDLKRNGSIESIERTEVAPAPGK